MPISVVEVPTITEVDKISAKFLTSLQSFRKRSHRKLLRRFQPLLLPIGLLLDVRRKGTSFLKKPFSNPRKEANCTPMLFSRFVVLNNFRSACHSQKSLIFLQGRGFRGGGEVENAA